MDSSPICHPSPTKKMKCSFLDYVQLLMVSRDGRWPQIPSATPLQPIKWNAHFSITFNFWWSAWLVNGLETHLPSLSTQKNEMLIFRLCSTSHDLPGWSMDSNPIHCPSPAKKLKCSFFGLHSTSDDWPGWVMDSNPFHHPSPAKKMKCSFLDYIQLLMIGWTGRWTQTSSTTHIQPIKWNPHFWITLNFWWSAGLVDGLEPHLPPLSSQKNEMLIFGFCSTSDDQPGWSMDSNPICHPSPANKMICSSLDYIELLMISWTGRWTQTPSATPLQPKTWNAHFCITFNFWCWPDLSMDLNPIHHPSTAKKMKCFFFGLRSTSDDWLGWVMDSNLIHHPSPAKKMKCSFSDYIQLLMIGRAGWWTQTPSTTRLQPKNEMHILWLCSTSADWSG